MSTTSLQSNIGDGAHSNSLFSRRRAHNEARLRRDVQAILESLPPDTLIRHHVEQFNRFWPKIYNGLQAAYDRLAVSRQNEADRETFLALALGALTAQWSILRAVAFQRLPGSPYLADLQKLDQKARQLYERLLLALRVANEATQQYLSSSYPLMYIGDVANLRLFGNAPAVVSVTFGALYEDSNVVPTKHDSTAGEQPIERRDGIEGNRSALAIGHELGHIVCGRMPHLIPNLEYQLTQKLGPRTTLSRKKSVLLRVMLPWLEEIIADLFGAALEGPQFARSALQIGTLPDGSLTRSDGDHPPSVIRPWLQLRLLQYLAKKSPSYNEEHGREIAILKQELEEQTNPVLDGRFETIPVAMAISLREVREEALELVETLLNAKPGEPRDRSMGDVLLICATTASAPSNPQPPLDWGEQISDQECYDPALEVPRVEFDEPTPGPFCDFLHSIGIPCQ